MRSIVRTSTSLLLLAAVLLAGCHGRLKNPTSTIARTNAGARKAEIDTYPWPDYVSGEDRVRIEDCLSTIFDVGGRDAQDAELILVGMDREAEADAFRVAGRLVSEMKTVLDSHGVEEWEGRSRVMVLDRILRKIDGVMARRFGEEYGLDIDYPASRFERAIRTWNWWYREGRFIQRFEPWDPRYDMQDEEEQDPDLKPAG